MRAYPRIALLLALLVATVLSTSLSGCSGRPARQAAPTAQQPPTQVPQQLKTEPTATATPAQPAPTATPTPAPATPALAASTVQTITQEVAIGEPGQGTFTITESIALGNVDGIEYTSASAPMPTGAAPYDGAHLPKIGDVVQHPGGLIVQVTGVKTLDVDADDEFILVDVVVGNASKERQLVAADPLMEIVSGDGHWYSAYWYSLYWGVAGSQAYLEQMALDLHQKLLQHNLTSYFSAVLEPGQAASGTAVFLVPKSAKELAFGFQPWEAAIYLVFANEYSPTVFIPLGLRGDFPLVGAGAAPLAAGTTYKVGQAFKAPQRGVALEVKSVWQRLESMGMWELQPDEQFVVVSLLAPALGGKPLDAKRELALVDGKGQTFELQEYTTDWLTTKLGRYNQRGVLVFKGPRAAEGLQLKFNPLDPATMDNDSPQPLAGEAATIDLGEPGQAPVAAIPTPTAEPGATPEPTPTVAPKGNAQLGDRVVNGKLAVTLNGFGTQTGPEGRQKEGYTWLLVDVTVENVSNGDAYSYPEDFSFVDQSGVVYDALLNKPSAWDEVRKDVIDYAQLAPGAKLTNKILLIQLEDSVLPGLKLRHHTDAGGTVLWDLGL